MLFGRPTRSVSPPSAGALLPDDGGNRIDFRIRDLGTRSVRLSPSRAYVTRDINDIHIKPGTNHITVIGLSPTVDEHSIKVEGVGPAFISDIAVQLVPNRDIFEEVYPETDDNSNDSSTTESDIDDDSDGESDGLTALREELDSLFDGKRAADELIASAEVRLKILDSYSARIANPERPVLKEGEQAPPDIPVGDSLETYRSEREKAFRDNVDGKAKGRTLEIKIDKLHRRIKREVALAAKSKSKAAKSKDKALRIKNKERKSKERKKTERAKENLRIRRQREATWPRNVYAVRVTLETAVLTPGSTRRSSLSSDIVPQLVHLGSEPDDSSLAPGTCRLTLSYITTSAFWCPAYDLTLSTVTNSASLCFDALLANHTSEVWSNCKVSLTTSQTESSDLTDKLPSLQPWQVKLVSKDDLAPGLATDEILLSTTELEHRRKIMFTHEAPTEQKPRWEMFGVDRPQSAFNNTRSAQAADPSKPSPFAQVSHAPGATSLFGAKPAESGGLFGSTNAPSSATAGTFGQPRSAEPRASLFGGFGSTEQPGGAQRGGGFSAAQTISTGPPVGGLFGGPAGQIPSPAPATGGGLFGNSSHVYNSGGQVFGGERRASPVPAPSNSTIADATPEPTGSNPADTPTIDITNQEEGVKETFHDASEGLDEQSTHNQSFFFNSSTPALPMSWGEDSSSFMQMGLTSNHDLSGLKTLMPSAPAPPSYNKNASLFAPLRLPNAQTNTPPPGASRHRVTRITSFTDIDFTRTVVPKYKPAAYLRVKLRNGGKIPLLSGMASVTLDGSFLGRMQIPPAPGLFGSANVGLVRPGEYMHLDLGVDPTIRVTYTGPTARNGKEGPGGYLAGVRGEREVRKVYTRTVALFNGREPGNAGVSKPRSENKKKGAEAFDANDSGIGDLVKVTVLDQIPTTEDERLKIKILKPAGLSKTKAAEKVEVTGSGGVLSFFSSSSSATTRTSTTGRLEEGSKSHSGSGGDESARGESASDDMSEGDSSWGKAQARMMPKGQVEWDVCLKANRMVELVLEYECVYPKEDGARVVNAN